MLFLLTGFKTQEMVQHNFRKICNVDLVASTNFAANIFDLKLSFALRNKKYASKTCGETVILLKYITETQQKLLSDVGLNRTLSCFYRLGSKRLII